MGIAERGVLQARESLRVVQESFSNGLLASSDVLDAQTELSTAEMQLVDARAALRLAEANLKLATGVGN